MINKVLTLNADRINDAITNSTFLGLKVVIAPYHKAWSEVAVKEQY